MLKQRRNQKNQKGGTLICPDEMLSGKYKDLINAIIEYDSENVAKKEALHAAIQDLDDSDLIAMPKDMMKKIETATDAEIKPAVEAALLPGGKVDEFKRKLLAHLNPVPLADASDIINDDDDDAAAKPEGESGGGMKGGAKKRKSKKTSKKSSKTLKGGAKKRTSKKSSKKTSKKSSKKLKGGAKKRTSKKSSKKSSKRGSRK